MNVMVRDKAIAAPVPEITIPGILEGVLAEFHREGISYCYWKSSLRVRSALYGGGDLDLLVALSDLHRMEAILTGCGFKRFASVASRDHPSISSFLGFDEVSGRLIHLHVHFRLVLGEPLLKNYHVPWEQEFLARAIFHPVFPIRVLDPASEALLLAVRSSLELHPLDPVALRNWRAIRQKFARDREALSLCASAAELRSLAAKLMGEDMAGVPHEILFDGSAGHRRAGARRLKRHLAPFRAYSGVEARLRAGLRAMLWAAGSLNKKLLHLPRAWNRRVPGGGRVVALIGVDGSGKSTAVATIKAWLSDEVDVMPIYLGTGDGRPSLILLPFKLLVPLVTRLLGTKPKGPSHGQALDKPKRPLYSVLLAIWATVLAIEKRDKLLSARRGADRGLFVLADRYPQDEIPDFNDGPLLGRLSKVPHWLRRFESNAYALARRLPPDLVLKLLVTPETAGRREPAMDPAVIERRVVSVEQLNFAGARVVAIDAEQPLERVILAIKREVWRIL